MRGSKDQVGILLAFCGIVFILISESQGTAIIQGSELHDAELIEKFQKETGISDQRDPRCKILSCYI